MVAGPGEPLDHGGDVGQGPVVGVEAVGAGALAQRLVGAAMAAGYRLLAIYSRQAVAAVSNCSGPVAPAAMSGVAAARTTRVYALMAGVRSAAGYRLGPQLTADTRMAIDASLATCARHWPSGGGGAADGIVAGRGCDGGHVEKIPDLTARESGQELYPLASTGSEFRSPRLNTRASRPRDSHRRGPA
jgi:hypothetical protein